MAPAAEHNAIRYFTLAFGAWMLAFLSFSMRALGQSMFGSLGAAGRILSSAQNLCFGFGCVFALTGIAVLVMQRNRRG